MPAQMPQKDVTHQMATACKNKEVLEIAKTEPTNEKVRKGRCPEKRNE